MSESENVQLPVGPADLIRPRQALARLAVSSTAAEIAENATGIVPTYADEYNYPTDDLEQAIRILGRAEELLALSVVYARERGASWADIGQSLGITRQSAHERFAERERAWVDALDRPFTLGEIAGSTGVQTVVVTRLPDALGDPDFTIDYLDKWCAEHIATVPNASTGVESAKMVSAKLPRHTRFTEMASVIRTSDYLRDSETVTAAERDAHEIRKQAVFSDRDLMRRGTVLAEDRRPDTDRHRV